MLTFAERTRHIYRLSNGNYSLVNGALDTRELGILRSYSIKPPIDYDRITTPLSCVLFDYYSLLLNNSCSKGGRTTWHADGTGSQVNWGVVVGPGDCIQRWDINMSGTFMLATDNDSNRVVKQNLNTVTLMQFHTALTTAKDIAESLKLFVDDSIELFGKFQPPLAFLTDCSGQILTGAMTAMAS